jgi:hypothetical protein
MKSQQEIEAEIDDMELGLELIGDSKDIRPDLIHYLERRERETLAKIKALEWVLGKRKKT